MKKLVLILSTILFTLTLFGQNSSVDELFEKYANKDGFTTVIISKNMFSLFASEEESKEDFTKAIKGIESIRILSSDETVPKGSLNFFKEIGKSLPMKEFEELMSVKEKDQEFKMLIRKNGKMINEFLMIGGGNSNVLISITGNIDLRAISNLSKAMDIKGMENLNKIEKK